MTKREDLRLQGDTGSKTGGDQSEKGNKKRAHRDTTRISRMLGTTAFSARTEFSVTTGSSGPQSGLKTASTAKASKCHPTFLFVPHCRTGCSLRQTHSAILRKFSENRPPSSCTNRCDASGVATPCLVFALGKAPRFSLFSYRIGCIAKDKGLRQSHWMGLG